MEFKVVLLAVVVAWIGYKFLSHDREINYRDLLNNKNVIVTGGSSGIGEEMAKFCVEMGANVVVVARRENLLRQVIDKLHSISSKAKVKYIVADMSDPKIAESIIRDSVSFLGSLDYLFLNHAFIPNGYEHVKPWAGSKDQHDQMSYALNTNFHSFITLTDNALPHLRSSGGNLVAISSAMVDMPAFYLPYSCSKGALNTFFTGLRQEFIRTKTNISVMVVHLGFVETENALKGEISISSGRGKDMKSILSVFDSTSQVEAGRAIVQAASRREEAYFYYPTGQMIWVTRCLRILVKDPDQMVDKLEDLVLYYVNLRKQYFG